MVVLHHTDPAVGAVKTPRILAKLLEEQYKRGALQFNLASAFGLDPPLFPKILSPYFELVVGKNLMPESVQFFYGFKVTHTLYMDDPSIPYCTGQEEWNDA
ncbi:hypothetical protein V3C99_016575 [Haemonchus contortus]